MALFFVLCALKNIYKHYALVCCRTRKLKFSRAEKFNEIYNWSLGVALGWLGKPSHKRQTFFGSFRRFRLKQKTREEEKFFFRLSRALVLKIGIDGEKYARGEYLNSRKLYTFDVVNIKYERFNEHCVIVLNDRDYRQGLLLSQLVLHFYCFFPPFR